MVLRPGLMATVPGNRNTIKPKYRNTKLYGVMVLRPEVMAAVPGNRNIIKPKTAIPNFALLKHQPHRHKK